MALDKEDGGDSLELMHKIVLFTVDHIDAMMAYWDRDQVCRFANAAYRAALGRGKEEIVGLTMEEVLGPFYATNLPYIERAYAGQTQVFEREAPLAGGGFHHTLVTYAPHLSEGKVQGLLIHVADVTPRKRLEQELREAKERAEHLSTHDYLTGLPNRVLLAEQLSAAIARAKREHERIAVMSIDLDGFKQVNDTYGHAAGDRLLVEVAGRMRRAVREMDTVARYGGDEFIIIAPQVESEKHTSLIAERLLTRVREPFRLGDDAFEPAFSVGIALFPQHGSTPEELIGRSDSAFYSVKRGGKNRYAFFHAQRDASEGGSYTLTPKWPRW